MTHTELLAQTRLCKFDRLVLESAIRLARPAALLPEGHTIFVVPYSPARLMALGFTDKLVRALAEIALIADPSGRISRVTHASEFWPSPAPVNGHFAKSFFGSALERSSCGWR